MTDYSELKRLAEAATNARWHEDDLGDLLEFSRLDGEDQAFILAASPSVVFALVAENERYRQYGCDTCDGSGHLHRIDGEYYGACTSCGSNELEQAKLERDQLKAENERLRKAANDLRRFLACEDVHHDHADQHEAGEPCKVLARIDAVLGGGGKPVD